MWPGLEAYLCLSFSGLDEFAHLVLVFISSPHIIVHAPFWKKATVDASRWYGTFGRF